MDFKASFVTGIILLYLPLLSGTFILTLESVKNETDNSYKICGLGEADQLIPANCKFNQLLLWDTIDSLENLKNRISNEIPYLALGKELFARNAQTLNSCMLYDSSNRYLGCFLAYIDESYDEFFHRSDIRVLTFFKKQGEANFSFIGKHPVNMSVFTDSQLHEFKVNILLQHDEEKGLGVTGNVEVS